MGENSSGTCAFGNMILIEVKGKGQKSKPKGQHQTFRFCL